MPRRYGHSFESEILDNAPAILRKRLGRLEATEAPTKPEAAPAAA